MTDVSYTPRLADSALADLVAAAPGVMVTGPRAAGKTTSARRLANDLLRLDDPGTAAVVRADPDAALRRVHEPAVIDEWQEVPEVLGAVKRAIDDDPRPSRFILTGSVEADLTSTMWPGTGRVIRAVLHGLTQREITERVEGPGALPAIINGELADIGVAADALDLNGYLTMAAAGGFPEPALRLPAVARAPWFDSYIEHVVTRDVLAAGSRRDPTRLRRFLEVLALSSAGLPADSTLYAAADVDRRTGDSYERLLSALFLLDLVPAWASNRLSRLTKRTKRYLDDPALMLAAARIDEATVLGDPDLLGRLLDTFVAAQLRPEVDLLRPRARLHHLRTEGGRQEVDLIIDLGAGRVVGVEVKAGTAPTRRDARHLMWLRDELGAGFVRGVVFHTGRLPFELDERIWALPIASLWA